MAINLAEKYSPLVDERFKHESFTEIAAGTEYDWDGVNAIKIWSVDRVSLNDYDKTASANRFGTPTELGDTIQTLPLTVDKSFSFTIDKGNAQDQFNIKQANTRIKAVWDEEMTPFVDMLRLTEWANGAGLADYGQTAPNKSNILEKIMLGNAKMSNQLVPRAKRTLFIGETLYVAAKLSDQITHSDSMATKAYGQGVVGTLDGIPVVPVPDSYLPEGVQFMLKYKQASADPTKLKTLRVHKDPPGIDGDLCEGRLRCGAFVRAAKKNGIYVYSTAAAT